MRITNQLQNQMLSGSIIRNQSDVYRLQEQVASGELMKVASEDPQSWAAASRLHRQEADLAQYERNAIQMESRLTSMDLSLRSIGDLLQTASELAVQAGQGTLNSSDRQFLAEEVNQLLEELVMQANTKYDGHYLFGGIQSGTEPFTVVRDAEDRISSVAYAGSEEIAEVEVGEGDMMGRQMVGGGSGGVLMSDEADAFAALVDMRDRLLNQENLSETDVLGLVDDAYEQVLMGRAAAGAQVERLGLLESIRTIQQAQVQTQISEKEGVDVAEAVARLSAKNVAYEAALAMSAKVMNISLLKYI